MSLLITVNGIDITEYVINEPMTPNAKPDWGQIPLLPELQITVRSKDKYFIPTNPISFLYGQQYSALPVIVKRDGAIRWQGALKDASWDGQSYTCTLIAESLLSQQIRKSSKPYFEQKTPAFIALDILTLHGVPVNLQSFQKADSLLNDNAVLCSVNPDVIEWVGTLGDLLQLLAVAGVGRFYQEVDGTIGFETWDNDLTPIQGLSVSDGITDLDFAFEQHPRVNSWQRAINRGYSVKYAYATVEDDLIDEEADIGASLFTADFGSNSAVTLWDANGATYVGSQWVEMSLTSYSRIELFLDKQFGESLRMDTGLKVKSQELGVESVLPIEEIDNTDPRWVRVVVRFKNYVLE